MISFWISSNVFFFFLDQPLESHALRIKPEFNIIPEQRSQLENSIDSVLEADDFMEFSRLIEAVIEFHNKEIFRTCIRRVIKG